MNNISKQYISRDYNYLHSTNTVQTDLLTKKVEGQTMSLQTVQEATLKQQTLTQLVLNKVDPQRQLLPTLQLVALWSKTKVVNG